MTTLREAAQQALQAMDYMLNNGEWYQAQERADALRAALEPPQAEPLAWRYQAQGRWLYVDKNPNLWQDKPDGEIQSLHAQQTTDCLIEEKNGAKLTHDTNTASK
jgi:hypothetical protein